MARVGRIRKQKVTLGEKYVKAGLITPELGTKIGNAAKERAIADGSATNVLTLEVNAGPIAWLRSRGLITQSQFEAAERFRGDFERSGLDTLRAQDFTRPVVDQSGHKGAPEFRQRALDDFNSALRCLGKILKDMVCDVVLRDVPIADAASFYSTPDRAHQSTANRALLIAGLIQLVEHYRLPVDWRR